MEFTICVVKVSDRETVVDHTMKASQSNLVNPSIGALIEGLISAYRINNWFAYFFVRDRILRALISDFNRIH